MCACVYGAVAFTNYVNIGEKSGEILRGEVYIRNAIKSSVDFNV